MATTSSSARVSFKHPFQLPGMDRPYPAGSYEVETDLETLDTVSTVIYHRVATRILLTRPGITEALTIDPKDLEAALLQDVSAA
ncbi:hypothetical protein K32_43230 [Kaistia sp. 32K]|uniref:hypothetical protein n=1 Tax=Kaistia sp. 32K TaxID=2795690 RepID=UPI001916B071|nr:hypothetical protein [Kaistia sp. 32K]BCP55706.1 hypothetical protein K32_43230 [Kaistia sp. 32K]